MPTLQDYARLAPFTIDELVDAANSVLRERPRLHLSKRTVRYYISEGVLPAPGGAPKFARYGTEHLVRLVGARCLLDMGKSLEACARTLDSYAEEGADSAISQVQLLVGSREQILTAAAEEIVRPKMYEEPVPSVPMGAVIRRIPLGRSLFLEAPFAMGEEEAIRLAKREIDLLSL